MAIEIAALALATAAGLVHVAQVRPRRTPRCMAALLIVLAIAGGGYLAFWAVGNALERGHIPGIAGKPTATPTPDAATDAVAAKES